MLCHPWPQHSVRRICRRDKPRPNRRAVSDARFALVRGAFALTLLAPAPCEKLPRPRGELRPSLAAILALVFALEASPARAEGGDWYGHQTLLTDAAALGFFGGSVGAALKDRSGNTIYPAGFAIAGAATYFLGGPIVHLAHGNRGGAVRSELARLLVPPAGAALGLGIGLVVGSLVDRPCCTGSAWGPQAMGAFVGAAVGFGAGALGAMVLDSATFAYEPPPSRPKLGVVPLLGPDRTRGLLLAMSFWSLPFRKPEARCAHRQRKIIYINVHQQLH